jgi:hypothetical protein
MEQLPKWVVEPPPERVMEQPPERVVAALIQPFRLLLSPWSLSAPADSGPDLATYATGMRGTRARGRH